MENIKSEVFFNKNELSNLHNFIRHRYMNIENNLSLFFEQMIIQAFISMHPLLQQNQWTTISLSAKEINDLARRLSRQQLKLQEWVRKQLWNALEISGIDPKKTSCNTDAFPAFPLEQMIRQRERQQAVSTHAELSGVLENLANAIGVEKNIILWTAMLSAVPEYFFGTKYDYQIVLGMDLLERKWLQQVAVKFGIKEKDALKRMMVM